MAYKVGDTIINTISELLKADGRKQVAAPKVLNSVSPAKFSTASIQRSIEHFERSGESNHSANRGTLGFLIDYCEENGISYTLRAAFAGGGKRIGYFIKRDPNL